MNKNIYKRWVGAFFCTGLLAAAPMGLSGCAVSGYDKLPKEQRDSVRRAEDYLNNLLSIKADFAQESSDQRDGDGRFTYTLKTLRLDYTRPQGMTLVAKKGHVTINDPSTGAITKLSLKRNPLAFFLRHPVHFSDDVQVTHVMKDKDSLQISLAEANNPSQGLLTLQFSDLNGRLSLIGLKGVDAHGRSLNLSLFNVKEEASDAVDAFSPSSSSQ